MISQVSKKKVLKLRREYKYRKQVAISLLLAYSFIVCGCRTLTADYSSPVTYSKEVKQGEKDGALIDSLVADVVKRDGKGEYVIEYSIIGQITEEYWNRSMILKKVRIIEENDFLESVPYDKRITLIPVQESFLGKAGIYPQPFKIKNRYELKNDSRNPIKKILFVCGDKEFLLELE